MVLGVQGLSYGVFNYALQNNRTAGADAASAGHVMQKVTVPICLGVGGIAIGGLMLLMGSRKPD